MAFKTFIRPRLSRSCSREGSTSSITTILSQLVLPLCLLFSLLSDPVFCGALTTATGDQSTPAVGISNGTSSAPEPAAAVARLPVDGSGISQRRNHTAERDKAAAAGGRAPKALRTLSEKNGFDPVRKMDSYIGWNETTSGTSTSDARPRVSTIYALPLSVRVAGSEKNVTDASDITASTSGAMQSNRRLSTIRRKYPRYYSGSKLQLHQDKRKTYSTSEDYEHQIQSYGAEYHPPQNYEYEESYNTIPEDLNNGFDHGGITDSWHVSYIPQDAEYIGPPLTTETIYKDAPVTVTRECNCPSRTRSYECESPSSSFLSLLSALGRNLGALLKLVATSSAPFLIPLLALKMIIVPLKILKFLKLIKLFLKFFIILPFLVRVVYPALSNSFNLHDFLYQKVQDLVPSHQAHLPATHHPHGHSEDVESRRGDANATAAFRRDDHREGSVYLRFDETNIWDMRACPSRVTCEMGAFLASSTGSHLPRNLASYLARKADQTEANTAGNTGARDHHDDDDEEEEEDRLQRHAAFKAFLVALGKKWTQDQCNIYECAVLF